MQTVYTGALCACKIVILFPEGSCSYSLHWLCVILVFPCFLSTWHGVGLDGPQRSFSTSPALWFYDLFVSPCSSRCNFCLVFLHPKWWKLIKRRSVNLFCKKNKWGTSNRTIVIQLIVTNCNLKAILVSNYNGFRYFYMSYVKWQITSNNVLEKEAQREI